MANIRKLQRGARLEVKSEPRAGGKALFLGLLPRTPLSTGTQAGGSAGCWGSSVSSFVPLLLSTHGSAPAPPLSQPVLHTHMLTLLPNPTFECLR